VFVILQQYWYRQSRDRCECW